MKKKNKGKRKKGCTSFLKLFSLQNKKKKLKMKKQNIKGKERKTVHLLLPSVVYVLLLPSSSKLEKIE
jgi:hypothetical protein